MGIDTVYEQDMQTAHIIQPAEEMAAIIQQFDNIVIVAHGSPDGDAIGATGAMGSLVKALGKSPASPTIWSGSPCPESSSPSPPPSPSSPA